MDFQEDHIPNRDDDERVDLVRGALCSDPLHEFCHSLRGIEWRYGFEDDANLLSLGIECGNTIWSDLVLRTVTQILLAVLQQVAVELLDVIFGEWNVLPRREHQLHDGGVTSNLLFISRRKRCDLQLREKRLDFTI